MSFEQTLRILVDRLTFLEQVVERQGSRMNNMIREAKVIEVDVETGTARVDAHGVETDLVPWLQYAGSIVDWDPLSVGQRVMFFSPNGDPAKGFILPGGYTDEAPQPHQEGEMSSRTIGGTKLETRADSHSLETETYRIKANVEIEGNVIIKGNVDFSDGYVKHNGTVIDDTHRHGGIVKGGDITETPV